MKIFLLIRFSCIVIILSSDARASRPEACGPQGVCKCGPTIKYYQVNCKNRSLEMTPQHFPANTTKIVLSENPLKYLPQGVFDNTSDVELVNLTDNSLIKVQEKLFARTVNLTSLLMSKNQLKEIPPGLLAHAPKLEYINLSSNNLSSIPEDLFKDNHKLKTILIMKNKLHILPPRMLTSVPNMEEIFLGYNKITEIPDGFFNATPKLHYLSIPMNNIKNLTKPSFAGLREMNYMSFAWNDLSILPSNAFGSLNLNSCLDMSHNKIKEIPHGLFNSFNGTHRLSVLYLQGNNLTYLPSGSFKGLKRLEYIFLNNNNISLLASDVFNGTDVKYIYMFGNKLSNIPNNSFGNRHIKELHLYENEIKSISPNVLQGMNQKLQLYLNCFYLMQIPSPGHNMSCVNQDFVPVITMDRKNTKLKRTLSQEGFVCKSHPLNTTCNPCPPGTYGNGRGACLPCSRGGFYQDKIGLKKCKTCTEGTFVNASGATSYAQCKLCPEGTNQTQRAGYRACFCKDNYTRTHRFMGCSLCNNSGLNCTFDYKFLRPGFYWNWSFPSLNLTLYSRFVDNLQTMNNLYDNTSIEYDVFMPFVHECPNDDSCLNNNSHTVGALNGTCAEGYRGWLCYKCENYYYRVLNSCKRCPGPWWIILETAGLTILFSGVLFFLISEGKDKGNGQQRGERSLADKVSSRLKIVLGFYQVIGELFESLHDINWVGPLSSLGKFLSFRNINVFSLFVRPRCLSSNFVIDAKLQFKIALLFPVFVLITAVLVYIVGKLILLRKFCRNDSEKTHHLKKLKSKLYYYILLLLFVTYTPTCVAIFAFYPKSCQLFKIYQNRNETISLLRSDFDLKCDENLGSYHTSAYVATIVYILTFPCVLLYLLNRYCRKINVRKDDKFMEHETTCTERTRLVGHSDGPPIPFWLKFICENYKPRFWYWEVVELARKVMQTAVVTVLGWHDKLTILSTIGISVLFLTLHAKFSPMKSSFEQRLQLFSLTAIFINVLIVAVEIPHEYGELVSTPLILLNVIILVTITGEMALGILRFVRDKYFRP